jgi:hypothetical protein
MVKLLGRTSGDQGSSASSTSGFMATKEFSLMHPEGLRYDWAYVPP